MKAITMDDFKTDETSSSKIHHGITGDCEWELNDTNLVISGYGEMADYDNTNAPWGTEVTQVTICSGITSIGSYAFEYCTELTNVTIPNSVISIGDYSFDNCSKLKSITIPSSLKTLGMFSFNECRDLTSVYIPESVEYIGKCAFRLCSSLQSIAVDLNNNTFDSRRSCNAIIDSKNNCLLFGCQNTIIPNGIEVLGEHAFDSCESLTYIELPDSILDIDDFAFSNCTGLSSVLFPNDLRNIGYCAFAGCKNLESVYFFEKVEYMGDKAFYKCPNLDYVYYSGMFDDWYNINIGFDNDELRESNIDFGFVDYNHDLKSLHFCDITLNQSLFDYDGSFKRPSFTVNDYTNNKTLVAGTDYTFSYYNNINSGVAELIIKGKNDYSESKTIVYKIIPKSGSSVTDSKSFAIAATSSNLSAPRLKSIYCTSNGITVSWDNVMGAYKYRLYYKGGSQTSWKKVIDTTSLSYTFTNVSNSTKYTFTVRCLDSTGKLISDYDSNGISITFNVVPVITKAENNNSGIKLTLGNVAGASKYRLFIKNGSC